MGKWLDSGTEVKRRGQGEYETVKNQGFQSYEDGKDEER